MWVKVRQWKDITEIYCQNDAVFSYYYYYVLNAVLIWLPLIIMLISYVQIFCTVRTVSFNLTNINLN